MVTNFRITIETTERQTGDQMQTNGVISISKLNRTDDGLYECVAENNGMCKPVNDYNIIGCNLNIVHTD